MLTPTHSLILSLAAGMPCGLAAAQHDGVLDRVPADAPMVVSIASVSSVFADANAFAQAAGITDMVMGVSMAQGMLALPGLDADRAAAFVFNSLDGWDDTDEPPMVALVPVSDYNVLTTSLGGTGEGVESLDFQGQPVFVKDIGGGYAVTGPTQELVEGFTAAEGAWADHQAAIGSEGQALAGEHGVMISVSVDAFADTMLEGWEMASQQMQMMAQMGGAQADQLEGQMELGDTVVRGFARDGQRGILGVTMDGRGVSLDLGASFKDGSEIAGFFADSSPAGDMLGMLPGGDYIFAWALNSTGEGIGTLMANMAEAGQGQGLPGVDMSQIFSEANGMAQVIGSNPAGIMAGLFTNTTTVISADDASAFIGSYGESVAAMNDTDANGMLITSSFDDEPTEVAGVQAYGWSIGMMPDMNAPGAMQMQMMMPMMFGGGSNGPNGYVAATDEDTVVMTYTRANNAVQAAVDAATNGGDLTANELLTAQADRLPSDAFMIAYVDLGTIARSMLPMAGMFAPELAQIQVPEAVSPVAFATTASGGSMAVRTVVPMDVITTVRDIAETMNGAGGGGMQDGGGQPEF
ncbi:MAG: hypothetical protein AAFR96_05215 [Planctomycetota bacterium]